MKPKRPSGISFYLILLAVIIVMSIFMSRLTQQETVTLSDLIAEIQSGDVQKVVVNGYTVQVTLEKTDNLPARTLSKQISPMWMDSLLTKLDKAEADGLIESYDYDEPTDIAGWLNIILIVVMVGGMGAFIWFTYSRQAGDGKKCHEFWPQPGQTE